MLVERVEIRADCAGEEDWVLWYDCDTAPQVVETDLRNVDAVNVDRALACFQEAE